MTPCGNDLPGTLGEAMPLLCEGAWTTAQVSIGGTAIAAVLAFAVGLAATSRLRAVRVSARTSMEFVRGTSVIIQMIWLFFALPLLTGYRLTPLFAGVLAIGLSMGAYGSEVVRGAVQAVPAAQWEAATALSLTSYQRMRHVILPQALVGMLPPLNNLLIELVKATSLVSAISLGDLIFESKSLINSGADRLTVMLLIMGIYLLFALAITVVMRLLERRAARVVGRVTAPAWPVPRWNLRAGRE